MKGCILKVILVVAMATLPMTASAGRDETQQGAWRTADAQSIPDIQSVGLAAPLSPNEESQPPVTTNGSIDAERSIATWVTNSVPDQAALQPDACTLPPPTLISPIGGGQINTLVPYFEWSRTASVYRIQISTTSSFSTLLDINLWYLSASMNPRADMNFNLAPNTAHFWRVASVCDDSQQGTFSSPASFITGDVTGPLSAHPQ